ncbi:MAG: flagellar hook assembly protein FlgD [Parvibaculaceae bacterium]|nr:flagellar hook assembly protein FlgD [Parvibaculaceae bacterium]
MALEIYGSNPAYVYQQVSTEATADEDATAFNADFNTFVALLTTQLQHQDPTSPMESAEFTNQLVQYAEVEQAIATNDHLEKLIAIEGANSAATAVNYIGKEVLTLGSTTSLVDDQATWDYSLETDAPETSITVYNSDGVEVYSTKVEAEAGSNTFEWDGENEDGVKQADGLYHIEIEPLDEDGLEVASSIMVAGIVTGVDFSSTTPIVTIGDTAFVASDILQVREQTTVSDEDDTSDDTDSTDSEDDNNTTS